MRQAVGEHGMQHGIVITGGFHAPAHAAGQSETGHRPRQGPALGVERRALLLRPQDPVAVELVHHLKDQVGLWLDAHVNL